MILLKSMPRKLIRILFWFLVFLTPLIFVSNTKEIFEFPKMFFVYGVGSTIIFVFLIGLLLRSYSFKFPPVFIVLFIFSILLSTLFSTHLYTSLWGYYSRFNGGLISLLIYFGLFIVAYNLFDSKFIHSLIFLGLIFSSIPISILGLSQYFGWGGTSVERVYSTLGQANWLAAYMSWSVLLVVHKFLKSDFDKKLFLWFGLFVLFFLCLWFAFSLSGLLALTGGLMVLIIFNRRSYFLNRLGFLLFFCFFILACFPGLFLPKLEDAFLDLQYLLLNFFKAYAQDGSHKTVDAGFIRLGLWEGTIKMFFDSPKNFLLGIGPETFPYQFPFYRPPSLNFSSEWDFILNKPHNYYLEMCAETGIFSLFFYLLILIKGILRKHPWVPSLLVSFAIVNFFGWPTVTTSLYFWIIMAGVFKNYEF